VCGSNIITTFKAQPHEVGLALGILDDDPGNRPVFHIFVGSKAPWYEITDELPQYEAFPPDYTPPQGEKGDA
jgi:hypothetical protein